MDERVKQSMARWPDVPAAWGWLRLDRRGQWRILDRNAPGFDETRDGAGNPIRHEALIDFICRNYSADPQGRWYFQNGPQRVYVDLEMGPLVWRVAATPDGATLVAHTGEVAQHIERLAMDPEGTVWAQSELGPGAIDDRQLAALLASSENGPAHSDEDGTNLSTEHDALAQWPQVRLRGQEKPLRISALGSSAEQAFGFVRRPRAN
jgi:hypothetical protein